MKVSRSEDTVLLALANKLEPVRPAVLLVEEGLAISKPASDAALALGRVRAVEEGDMLISNITEPVISLTFRLEQKSLRGHLPVNAILVLEQTQSNTVNWRIAPTFVEETAGPVEMVEVILIHLAAPEAHVTNLEVAPEMAGRVSIGLLVVLRTTDLIRQPVHRIVLVEIVTMFSQEFERGRPQGRDGLGRVVEVDGEAVGLVVVLHIAEDIVVDVTEEVNLGLDAPVVLDVCQCGVLVKHAAVPPAHLVVRDFVSVLDALLLQDLGRLQKQVVVNP